jgi:hypothetical protein
MDIKQQLQNRRTCDMTREQTHAAPCQYETGFFSLKCSCNLRSARLRSFQRFPGQVLTHVLEFCAIRLRQSTNKIAGLPYSTNESNDIMYEYNSGMATY